METKSIREFEGTAVSGWLMLCICIGLFILAVYLLSAPMSDPLTPAIMPICGWVAFALAFLGMGGFFALEPGQAAAFTLFGAYRGTVRSNGFHWTNPFYKKQKISLRARNLNGERLKVNDKRGNPIEIAAVIVWRVEDAARALFDVNNYEEYVYIQSETAVRHLANQFAYDHGEGGDNEITLRSGVDEVSHTLTRELQERLSRAGVAVDEARLTHLAYSPEIASAMLRRQQAEAVIAARQKIVHGAVSMVEMALKELTERGVVQLDEARKAIMVSNLLVVLCSESEVHPIVDTGAARP